MTIERTLYETKRIFCMIRAKLYQHFFCQTKCITRADALRHFAKTSECCNFLEIKDFLSIILPDSGKKCSVSKKLCKIYLECTQEISRD